MEKEITLILVIKNRAKESTKKCIDSLSSQTYSCDIIVVDYGSSEENLTWERKIFSKLKFIEVKKNTEIFNKCRALNIAIRASKTPFILQSDVDSIFSSNFVEEVVNVLRVNEKAIVLCQKIDLAKDGSEIGLHPISYGSCVGISASWLKSVHGYDEKYILWGGEDDDMFYRACSAGFTPIWITKKTWIKHQWHSEEVSDKSARLENCKYLASPNKRIVRNPNDWGEM